MAGFKCLSYGCRADSDVGVDALFKQLQTLLNQFAKGLALTPLKVDGIIGKGTTEFALIVFNFLAEADKGVLGSSAGGLAAGINSPEQLAGNALAAVNTLKMATERSTVVGAVAVTPPVPAPAPTPTPSPTTIATTPANAPPKPAPTATPAQQQAVQQRSDAVKAAKPALATSLLDRLPPWAAYASGAVLVLGAIGAVAYTRRRRGSSPAPAATTAVSGPKYNEYGLTWERWYRAAGRRWAPAKNSAEYRAWQAGEDPSDWRFDASHSS